MSLNKKDIRFAVWLLGVLVLGLILAFGKVPVQDNNWTVHSEHGLAFFSAEKLEKDLEQCGVCDEPLFVEEEFRENPWCKSVNVYKTRSGEYRMDIEEEQPVLRLLSWNSYLAKSGKMLPIGDGKTFRKPVVTGVLPSLQDSVFWTEFTEFGNFIDNHGFWKGQIQQLIVDKNQEVVLIPRVGNHTIVLGKSTRAKEKLEKLLLLYKEGFSYTGWYDYREINIALSNQIVCTKR